MRSIRVEITGDASGLENAFQQAGQSAQNFGRQVESRTRSVASSFDPLLEKIRETRARADELSATLEKQRQADEAAAQQQQQRLAMVGRLGAGFFAIGAGAGAASAALEAFNGEATDTSKALGDVSDFFNPANLIRPAGFFEAIGASAKRTREGLEQYAGSLKDVSQSSQALEVAQAASAFGFEKQAEMIRDSVDALKLAKATTEAMDFAQRQFNTTVVDGTAYLVAYKGAHDAAFLGSPTNLPQVYGGGTEDTRKRRPTQGLFLTPSERREDTLLGLEGTARVPLLNQRIAALKAEREGVTLHKNYARISREIAQTEQEIAAIKTAQNAADETARQAAKAEADRLAREAAARAKRQREARLAAEQARQFRLIGLSPTGDDPTPTIANLRKQLAQIRSRVAAGDDLPSKITNRFAGIAKALHEDITPETRDAIAEFFRGIREEWKKGDDQLKPFATAGINTNRIVSGLGLTAAQARRLRARLAGATTGGQMLAPGGGSVGAYGMSVPVNTTVYLDGQVVGRSTKRYLSNDSLRAPMQKRGPHAGRG